MRWKEMEQLDLYMTENICSYIRALISDCMFDFIVGVFIVKHLTIEYTVDSSSFTGMRQQHDTDKWSETKQAPQNHTTQKQQLC